jgi:hypothetical protein
MSDVIRPSWIPGTEGQLREAIEQGVIREDHHHDFKEMLAQGPSANRELAIDLASFAVDGGLLLVGVDEGPPPRFTPVPLAGLAERIDQVAGSRVDPPLRVTCRTIPSESDASLGYVVVAVPASPAAPHQVDNAYRGRSDTTNIKLSDGELRRIREERRRVETDAYSLLATQIAHHGVKVANSSHARLFVVAQPVYADPELLLRSLGDNPASELWRMVAASPILTEDFEPDFRHVHTGQQRAGGWAIFHAGTTDPEAGYREDELDIFFREDGGIRLYCERAGDMIPSWQTRVVMPSIIGGLVWRTLDLARSISGITGYVGNWHLAVGVTNLRGAQAFQKGALLQGAYSEDDYSMAFDVTTADLDIDPDALVSRLLGRLGRSLAGRAIDFPRRKS